MPLPTRPILRPRVPAVLAATLVAGGLVGCAAPVDRPAYREVDRPDAGDPADARTIDETGDSPPEGVISPTGAELGPAGDAGDTLIGPVILASDTPGSKPANASDPVSGEGYRTVGGVLLEVNGRPIFSDEVLAARRNALRGHAKRLPKGQFLEAALGEVAEEVRARVQAEFYLAVLEQNTSPDDIRLARLLTMTWRDRFITDHGGSEAVARRVAYEQEGMSLERLAEETYQQQLGRIFIQQRVAPQVRPAANDVRALYRELRDAGDLSTPAEIDFALIEIRPDASTNSSETSLAAAKARAMEAHARAEAGGDFALLAKTYSDNPSYAARGGTLPETLRPLQPGAYRIGAVDSAAWATPSGEVAPLVEATVDGQTRFFVVKTLEKRDAVDLEFEDVQARLLGELQQANQQTLLDRLSKQQQERVNPPTQDELIRVEATLRELLDQQYQSLRDS